MKGHSYKTKVQVTGRVPGAAWRNSHTGKGLTPSRGSIRFKALGNFLPHFNYPRIEFYIKCVPDGINFVPERSSSPFRLVLNALIHFANMALDVEVMRAWV